MRWRPDPEHSPAWSAAGGAVMVLTGGATVVLATQPSTSHIPSPLVWGCAALAVIGAYGMVAPLMHWWPWHRLTGNAEMNRLMRSQFKAVKRRRFWRRVLHRSRSEDGHVSTGPRSAPLSTDAAITLPAHAPQIVHVPASPYREPEHPTLTPETRKWLARQHERGKDETYKINLVRAELLTAIGGLGLVSSSMKLDALTNSANSWAKGLHSSLTKAGVTDAAASVSGSAPSVSGAPTSGDCDRLRDYLEVRMRVIRDVLGSAS